ncbi:MAG TPA: mannosyltransferase family protein [Ktedonobacterales bacterium]
MMTPLAIAATVRVLLFVVADVGCNLVAPTRCSGALNIWSRMDGGWYVAITQGGYSYSGPGQSSVNFFPLYPLAIYLVQPFAHLISYQSSYILAGLVISWLAFTAACILLYRLALDRFDQSTAYGAVLLLATFPFSFFYGAIYTESLYLALVLAAFLGIERRRWWLAAGSSALAGATRSPGIIVGVCVVLAYGLDWLRTRHPLRGDVLALALVPLGSAAYLVYCWVHFHDPFVYVKANHIGWHGGQMQLGATLMALHLLRHPMALLRGGYFVEVIRTASVVLLPLFVVALLPIARLLGLPYVIYALASLVLPLVVFSTVDGLGRYLSVIFPVFLVGAYALRNRPYLRDLICISGAAFLTVLTLMFVQGYYLPSCWMLVLESGCASTPACSVD